MSFCVKIAVKAFWTLAIVELVEQALLIHHGCVQSLKIRELDNKSFP